MTDVTELLNQHVTDEEARKQLASEFESLSGSALRKQLDDVLSENKEFKAKARARAFKDAGFDPESGPGKALAKLYEGESDPEAIQQFAKEEFGFEPTSAASGNGANGENGNQPDEAAQQRQSGEDRLGQLGQGQIPARDPSVGDQIKQAEAKGIETGDWSEFDRLQASSVLNLGAQ